MSECLRMHCERTSSIYRSSARADPQKLIVKYLQKSFRQFASLDTSVRMRVEYKEKGVLNDKEHRPGFINPSKKSSAGSTSSRKIWRASWTSPSEGTCQDIYDIGMSCHPLFSEDISSTHFHFIRGVAFAPISVMILAKLCVGLPVIYIEDQETEGVNSPWLFHSAGFTNLFSKG